MAAKVTKKPTNFLLLTPTLAAAAPFEVGDVLSIPTGVTCYYVVATGNDWIEVFERQAALPSR